MFDDIQLGNNTDIKAAEDKVGGGGFAKIEKTGIQDLICTKAYAGQSDGGAYFVEAHFENAEKARLIMREYITSGTKKGCLNYYIDKDGNKQYLPGYNKVKALDYMLTKIDSDLPKLDKRQIKLWDKDLKKELPVEKDACIDWIGKPVTALITKVLENKSEKIGDKWADIAGTIEKFEIDHFLDPVTRATRNELTGGLQVEFFNKWLEKRPEDYIYDKRTIKDEPNGEPNAGTSDSPFTSN